MALVGLWIIYAFFYVALKRYDAAVYAGYLAFIGEVGLDITAAWLTFNLWKKNTGQEKNIFALFCVSFVLAAITDASYNIITNILGIINFTNFIDSIFDIPFLGFLIAQLLAWIMVFLKAKPARNNRIGLISCLLIGIIILGIFIFGIVWKIRVTSLVEFYIAADTILQLLSFVFALLCLAITANTQIHLISSGYLVIVASDLIVHFEILTQTLAPASLLETTWVLGLLLIVFGLKGVRS